MSDNENLEEEFNFYDRILTFDPISGETVWMHKRELTKLKERIEQLNEQIIKGS